MQEPLEATQSPDLKSESSPRIEIRAPADSTVDVPSLSPSSIASRKRKRHDKAAQEIEVDMTAPEPPSKKALRQARKTKSLSKPVSDVPITATEAPTADTDLAVAREEGSTKRSEFGIWIGNLSFKTTKADLHRFLTEHSEITEDHITRIHLPLLNESGGARQKVQLQNKGFAYVDLTTSAAVDEALGLSEKLLTGRRLLIKNSKSFEGRPEKPKAGDEPSANANTGKLPSKRIFVGNLAFDITKEDLEEHFKPCGEVLDIHLATFEDTGKCKGFAWVEFENLEAGKAAIRGWVQISEDQKSESGNEGGGSGDDAKVARKSKARKTKKWWVNRMKGRQLKMEFAEDKATRYKKRFGKKGIPREGHAGDAAKTVDSDRAEGVIDSSPAAVVEAIRPRTFTKSRSRPMGNAGVHQQRKIDARTIKPGAALAAAPRLTAAIVEGRGKKTMFD